MARTLIGWENFELLHNSTGGILIKYIGNIFTAMKASRVRFIQEGPRWPYLSDCQLPGKPGTAHPVPHNPLSQPLPFPGYRLLWLPRTGLFHCWAGTEWQCGQRLVLPPARAACRGDPCSGGPGGHFSRSCKHLKLDILGNSVAADSILTASLSRMDTRDGACDNHPLLAHIACWPTATALRKFMGGYGEKGESSELWSTVSYLF